MQHVYYQTKTEMLGQATVAIKQTNKQKNKLKDFNSINALYFIIQKIASIQLPMDDGLLKKKDVKHSIKDWHMHTDVYGMISQ